MAGRGFPVWARRNTLAIRALNLCESVESVDPQPKSA